MAAAPNIALSGSVTEALLYAIETPVAILGATGKILRFNPAFERLTGYPEADAIGEDIVSMLMTPDVSEEARRALAAAGESLAARHRSQWRTKSGELRLLDCTCALLGEARGETARLVLTAVDVTDFENQNRQLVDSQSFLRSVINASPIALITIDTKGSIRIFSKQAEETFGYSESEVIGKNVSILMPEPDSSKHDEYLRRYLSTREPRIIGAPRKVEALRRNGERFPAILHVTMFEDGEAIFVGFIDDISEIEEARRSLAETERLLQHANRLGAMGEMATTIAHELNQPLTAAASMAGAVGISLKRSKKKKDAKAADLLDDAVGEIQRASAIIRQMRDFVRRRTASKALYDVNKVVGEALAVATIGMADDGVAIETDFASETGEAMIDRIQIQQVVGNLVRNAVEAMSDTDGEKKVRVTTAKRDGMIEIHVADNGVGIPEEIEDRMFQSFISTKPEGLGVGLSIVRTIIDAHQGEIAAKRNSGPGSTFIVRLPPGTV